MSPPDSNRRSSQLRSKRAPIVLFYSHFVNIFLLKVCTKSPTMQSLETAPHAHNPPNSVHKHHQLHTYAQPYISEFDTICRRDLPLWCIAGKITARIKCSHHKSETSLTWAKADRKCIDIRMYWLQICLPFCTGTLMCVMRNWGLSKGDKVDQ